MNYASLITGVVISVLTFLGQLSVFVAYAKKKELRTPTNYFMFALACADTLISTICLPGWTVQVTLNYWPLHYLLCDLWNVCDYAFATISIYTVLFITVDRFLAIKFPLSYKVSRTPFRTKLALVLIWVVCIAANFVFIFTTQYIYGQGRPEGECVAYYLPNSYILGFSMIFFLTWLPCVTATILYAFIWFDIRKSVRFSSQSHGGALSGGGDPTTKTIDLTEKELKALRTMSLVLTVFIISCLPLSFIFSMATMNPDTTPQVWIEVAYWLMYLNSTFNPVCYCLGNATYREALTELLCACCPSGGPGEDRVEDRSKRYRPGGHSSSGQRKGAD